MLSTIWNFLCSYITILTTYFPNLGFYLEVILVQICVVGSALYVIYATKTEKALQGLINFVLSCVAYLILTNFDTLALILLNVELIVSIVFFVFNWPLSSEDQLPRKEKNKEIVLILMAVFHMGATIVWWVECGATWFNMTYHKVLDMIDCYEFLKAHSNNPMPAYSLCYYVFNAVLPNIVAMIIIIGSFCCIIINTAYWGKKKMNCLISAII